MEKSKDNNKKNLIKPERPGGFLDFLPKNYLAREGMLKTIGKVFESFGFDPIETPRVEFFKTLSGEESETGKSIFRIERKGTDEGRLALPFDHTVPFSRILAANPYDPKKRRGIRLPWRRRVVGPVFRGESPQSGRYRQFYQFDVDIAGTSLMLADAEIVTIMYTTLKALGVKRCVVKINNRKILNGIAQAMGVKDRGQVSAADITKEMMRILDKLDKIGKNEVKKQLTAKPENELSQQPALSEEAVKKVDAYLDIQGTNKEKLDKCQSIFSGNDMVEKGISELRKILDYIEIADIPDGFVKVDFSIARGLDYYTGPVFEAVLLDVPQFGSVFGGGRYDDLVKRFTGESLPAVGASIGVDRLFAALDEIGILDKSSESSSEVVVLRIAPEKEVEYLKIAKEIRALDFNTEISLFSDVTFNGQFNFALSRGAKFVVICGEHEFEKDIIQVKNLTTRKQTEMKRNELSDYFRKEKDNGN